MTDETNASRYELTRLVKRYVDHQAQYQEAAKIVQKQKKLQERIKELYKQQNLNTFTMNQDGYVVSLEYVPTVYEKVDTTRLPDNIKSLYKRQVTMWKEKLIIRQKPG